MQNILHISDIHVSESPSHGMSEHSLRNLISPLIEDLAQLPKADTIFITGDIANAGQSSEYSIFRNHFLDPLLSTLNLATSRVIVVPGNHDSNRKEWKKSDSLAKASLIADPQQSSIRDILQEKIDDIGCTWSSNFTSFRNAIDQGKANILLANKFFSAYALDGIGIGCLNSAWLSNVNDKESLLVGEWQFQEVVRALKSFENRLILMHHPLDWLAHDDKKNLANLIHSSKICCLLYGHMHEFMMTKESQFSEDSVLKLQAGRLDTSNKDNYCGYSLIALHENNSFDSGTIFFRKYDSKRNKFRSWDERIENGKAHFSLTNAQPFDPERFSECCESIAAEIEFDLLCNTGLPNSQQRKLSEIFILPILASENEPGISENSFEPKHALSTQFQTLKSLADTPNSQIILGSENSGKSTLAKRLVLHYLKSQSAQCLDKFVFYLDLRGKPLKNTKRIITELLSFYLKDGNEPTFQSKIEKKLAGPSAVIIFDSIEHADPQTLKSIFEYTEATPARFILLGQLSARPMLREFTSKMSNPDKFQYLSLKSLKRSHLKELVNKWKPTAPSTQTSKMATNALKVVNGAGMANNPFVFSMLLSIRERKSDASRSYMHEADLVENFIEIILQKHVISLGNIPQYKDLLLYLGYVATNMHKNSSFSISENTLIQYALEFNKIISQNFEIRNYIDPILKSGILKRDEDSGYRFSQICFLNYALAYWISTQDLDYGTLDRDLDFTRFDKTIEYVSALKNDLKLLDHLSKKLDGLWTKLISENELADLESAEIEVIKCAGHDILDLLKNDSLESTFNNEPNEQKYDDELDNRAPLNDTPTTEVKCQREDVSTMVSFHESLSLYARAFRAAEHILNPHATSDHMRNIFNHYMNSISFSVRQFDRKGRPRIIQFIKEALEYEKIEEGKRGEIEAQINAFVNFFIAAIPNWGVAMMSSDFFNQRQLPRIENLRSTTTNNLEKILLTYCLCELDEVNVLDELKNQRYEKAHESSSLILKLIELIFLNFSISESEKEKLKAFATKMVKDRKTKQLFRNYTVVSSKIGQSTGITPKG